MHFNHRTLEIFYLEVSRTGELDPAEQQMLDKAEEAAHKAYAPYSGFKVGAAVLLENGEIIIGSNQENAAFPSGCCAERTALYYAGAGFPDTPVISVLIVALQDGKILKQPVTPCGTCRQVIAETQKRFNHPIRVIMVGEEFIRILPDGACLLPFPFEKIG